jgi:hypothetical protein
MRQIFLFCIVLSLNIPLSVVGQETEELRKLTREVEVLRKKGLSHIKLIENVYDREKDEAENIFQDEVAKRRKELLSKLNAEIDSAMEAKNLDKAIKLKELVEKVNKQEFGKLLNPAATITQKDRKMATAVPPAAAVAFAGHSYLIVNLDGISWEDARAVCKRMGGDLVVINTREEQQFIQKIVGSKNERNFWVGARRTDRGWFWVDGKAINPSFWDSRGPTPDFAAAFVYFAGSLGTIWNNTSPCPTIPGFICEWE